MMEWWNERLSDRETERLGGRDLPGFGEPGRVCEGEGENG